MIVKMMMAAVLDPKPTAPPGVETSVNTFLGYAMWIGGACTVLALIATGCVVVLNAFGRAGDHAEQIVRSLSMVFVGAMLITSSLAIARVVVSGV